MCLSIHKSRLPLILLGDNDELFIPNIAPRNIAQCIIAPELPTCVRCARLTAGHAADNQEEQQPRGTL
eukprot:2194176-Pyramimonas_sp.AAC.1